MVVEISTSQFPCKKFISKCNKLADNAKTDMTLLKLQLLQTELTASKVWISSIWVATARDHWNVHQLTSRSCYRIYYQTFRFLLNYCTIYMYTILMYHIKWIMMTGFVILLIFWWLFWLDYENLSLEKRLGKGGWYCRLWFFLVILPCLSFHVWVSFWHLFWVMMSVCEWPKPFIYDSFFISVISIQQ